MKLSWKTENQKDFDHGKSTKNKNKNTQHTFTIQILNTIGANIPQTNKEIGFGKINQNR